MGRAEGGRDQQPGLRAPDARGWRKGDTPKKIEITTSKTKDVTLRTQYGATLNIGVGKQGVRWGI